MYDEQFGITWDETDAIQAEEDDWVSSVIGTEEDAIGVLMYACQS